MDTLVIELCNLSFSIRKNFINDVLCDVIDMDVAISYWVSLDNLMLALFMMGETVAT